MTPFSTYWHGFKSAWRFYRTAVGRFDLHSTFLTQWAEAALEDKRWYYAFDDIERIRHYWMERSGTVVLDADLGAGSRAGQSSVRSYRQLARLNAVSAAEGRLLFRIINHRKPANILELGTSLGISTLYMRRAALSARLITLEGQPKLSQLATHSFQLGSRTPIDLRQGRFADTLLQALRDLGQVDVLYLDGDHRGDACLRYLQQAMPYLGPDSLVLVSDIHWSEDMYQSWLQMRELPGVTQSVDLFHLGVLFFRTEWRQAQHWSLVPYRYKPWRLGLGLGRSHKSVES